MVSKVAVVALVAVIAIPILVGYAFNLEETTVTEYAPTGESVNVTDLLRHGTGYSYSNANSYQLNTKFNESGHTTYPYYANISSNKTSFKAAIASANGTNIISSGATISNYSLLSYVVSYKMSEGYVTMTYFTTGGTYASVQYFHSLDYNYDNDVATIAYYTSDTTVTKITVNDMSAITGFTKTGSYNGSMYVIYNQIGSSNYVDLSSGYYIVDSQPVFVGLPNHTKSVLFTIDLSSVTSSTYSMKMVGPGSYVYTLEKSTVGSEVKWLIRDVANPSRTIDLYYDQDSSNNTYQFFTEFIKVKQDSTYDYYTSHNEFRYVGAWPNLFGEANAFITYTDDVNTRAPAGADINFSNISFSEMTNNKSPLMRFDEAFFRAFEYPEIGDQTYYPSSFKSNPATTISDIGKYGESLTFGGNTYTVTDGKITIDGRKIPVEGLVLSSVPDGSGDYENKIGNTVISTSGGPSSIVFNGSWSASVSTKSMQSQTITKTEWKAGEFGWDGIDHNFLIVGLIGCLAAFIGCGIYARKKGTGGLIPVMIVCGCAAVVFFIML